MVAKSQLNVVSITNKEHRIVIPLDYLGMLVGNVSTKDGEACNSENMKVVAFGMNGGRYETAVQEDGNWILSELPMGEYRIEIEDDKWRLTEQVFVELQDDVIPDVVELKVSPKRVFIASPAFGPGPLSVSCRLLDNVASDDCSVEWDFDGDGVTDSTDMMPNWTYTVLGDHFISLTITKENGEATSYSEMVKVLEPVENVLYDDVILIHEMDKPPYEFVSYDGKTFVMREVADHPVKPQSGAKMLFKHADNLYAIKILDSRRVNDCYYMTVKDATMGDFFSSYSYCVDLNDTGQKRGISILEPEIEIKGICVNGKVTVKRKPIEHYYSYKNATFDTEWTAYDDGFSINADINITEVGGSPESTVLLFPPIPLPGPIPCVFKVEAYIRAEAKLNGSAGCSFNVVENISWGVHWGKDRNDRYDLDPYLYRSSQSPLDGNDFQLKIEGIKCELGIGIKGTVGIAAVSIDGLLFDSYASLADLSFSWDMIRLNFGLNRDEGLSFAFGSGFKLTLALVNAKVNNFSGSLWKRDIWDSFHGWKWIWGGPVEEFDYTSTEPVYHQGGAIYLWDALFTPRSAPEKYFEYTNGHTKVYHKFNGLTMNRKWHWGDGTADTFERYGVTHTFKDKGVSYPVTLQPYGIGGVPGTRFTRRVSHPGEACPKCGHLYSENISAGQCSCKCHGYYENPGDKGNPPVLQSCDPNEVVGPRGVGDSIGQRLVEPGEWLDYTVYFENKPTADAAAQEIWVKLNLDASLLDLSSFQFGEISFGQQQVNTLNGKAMGKFAVAQEGTPYQVRGNMTYDRSSGAAQWYLRSYDPANDEGGNWPVVTSAGFLPPNDDKHSGEGYVCFRVKVRDDAPAGRRIDCSATITFDRNQPITTSPAWFNWIKGTDSQTEIGNLTWNGKEGAHYQVSLWTGNQDPSSEEAIAVANSGVLGTNRWRLPSNLTKGTTYFWQVTTIDADGERTLSPVWGFEMDGRVVVDLVPGWNLLSIPFKLEDYTERQLLGRKLFTLQDHSYVKATSLEAGRGYWLLNNDARNNKLDFIPANASRAQNAAELKDGWNMLGPTENTNIPDERISVWQYVDGEWQYIPPGEDSQYDLNIGQGYWIYQEPLEQMQEEQ